MRLVIIFMLLLFTVVNANARNEYLPYGTMKVNNHLIADQTEILVQEWLGYIVSSCDTNMLRCQKSKRRLTYADETYLEKFRYPDSLLPDTGILNTLPWRILLDTSDGYGLFRTHGANWTQSIPVNLYLVSVKSKRSMLEELLQEPITGISYEQAQAFCRWRTQIDSMRSVSGWGFQHYVFRLPTIEEFNDMNLQRDSVIRYPRSSDPLIGSDVIPAGFNYRNAYYGQVKNRLWDDLQQPWEFSPDALGLYSIQGNVAEMTSREGAACGGSYFHYAIESYRYNIQVYEHPERWLGFRCVATPTYSP